MRKHTFCTRSTTNTTGVLSTRIYASKNKFIFHGKFNYTYFPEYYYGIETEDPESKKDTIEYNRDFL